MPVEPPTPSAEQLAQWQALVERIRQGDHSQVVAWDESTAGVSVGTYHVFLTRRVHQQLRGAPAVLAGWVAGIIAVLRVDPIEPSMIFRRRRLGAAGWTVAFGAAGGLLTYWVLSAKQMVVLVDLTWARWPSPIRRHARSEVVGRYSPHRAKVPRGTRNWPLLGDS